MAVHRDFNPEPVEAYTVRRFVANAAPKGPHLDDVVLVASEMAANVIRHARTNFRVSLEARYGMLRVEVSNGSSVIPAIEDPTESNRGLRIIDALAQRWGIESTETGKTIWAEFLLQPAATGWEF